MSNKSVIITAGGIGRRMQSSLPKQFILINEKPILMYTIKVFYDFDPKIEILLTLPEDWRNYWEELLIEHDFKIPHRIISGGKERYNSIKNALEKCTGEVIAVHDGVRPLVEKETIQQCFEEAKKSGAAIPVIPIAESMRREVIGGTEIVDRSQFLIVQTPQCFQREILLKAYQQPYHQGITDDASLVEESGQTIETISGNDSNIKITTQSDLKYAGMFL
ncbi:MAG: 2-C-methyl-D-erythritol 4-phosphate cytidylyltransferase [Crocinitomicaceae bacterium]|nr:2-C-methyl-D-erythritol 4-phosphate cytidylyltransferase [Flavobacteriales bacterium]NQZ36337.1 2-C-methyl-D-erythritol 4-phosphate cytidylyltransferase [Crocinitomicaceae bacterium]PHR31654.1 MAG: 2-C-methyl-D-erythritol 4-phosphate cytidylyltransferase [Fluviicola sp.]